MAVGVSSSESSNICVQGTTWDLPNVPLFCSRNICICGCLWRHVFLYPI